MFGYVRVIPGDTNIVLGSDSSNIMEVDSNFLEERIIEEDDIPLRFLSRFYFDYKLDEERVDWFNSSIQHIKTDINEDFYPRAVYYGLSFWNAMFSPYLDRSLRWLTNITLKAASFFLFIWLFILRKDPYRPDDWNFWLAKRSMVSA